MYRVLLKKAHLSAIFMNTYVVNIDVHVHDNTCTYNDCKCMLWLQFCLHINDLRKKGKRVVKLGK